jgi:hypothetical protein
MGVSRLNEAGDSARLPVLAQVIAGSDSSLVSMTPRPSPGRTRAAWPIEVLADLCRSVAVAVLLLRNRQPGAGRAVTSI